jgi:hypothetical protein
MIAPMKHLRLGNTTADLRERHHKPLSGLRVAKLLRLIASGDDLRMSLFVVEIERLESER